MAVLDGADGEELATMAAAGIGGNHPGSCHRGFMAHFSHNVKVPVAQDVVSCKDPKTGKASSEKSKLLLPHLLFQNWLLNMGISSTCFLA